MATFLGMMGTGDWTYPDDRPKDWRQQMLRLYPNGSMALTGIMSKMGKQIASDPEYKWKIKALANQRATVTGVYVDAALGTAYVKATHGGAEDDTLYVRMSANDSKHFVAGKEVRMVDASHGDMVVVGLCTARVTNGASSYIAVQLMEADDNGASTDLSNCDACYIMGNANAEGSSMPEAVAYEGTWYYNYTQIFKTALSITNTAKNTRFRLTTSGYQEMKREALELHGIEMEKALLWGIRRETTGSNGEALRLTGGLDYWIRNNASSNVFNYVTDSGSLWNGQDWLAGGEYWFDEQLEKVFRYGSTEKLAVCGSTALLHINRLVKNSASYQIANKAVAYGIRVMEWNTPFGTVNILRHPLMTYEATTRNLMYVLEPRLMKYRHIANRDTKFIKDNDSGEGALDALNELFLTEAGYEFHHPEAMAIFSGFGEINTN